jgi:hypothetical protein
LDNLVAACGPCNRRKSGTPFEPVTALLPLRIAQRLKGRIERRIKDLELQAQETELDVLIELRRRFEQRRETEIC